MMSLATRLCTLLVLLSVVGNEASLGGNSRAQPKSMASRALTKIGRGGSRWFTSPVAPTNPSPPQSPGGRRRDKSPANGEDDDGARRLTKILINAEAAARLVRLCALLAIGGFRFASSFVVEVTAPLVSRTVAVVELRGVIIDDRESIAARTWCLPYWMSAAEVRSTDALSVSRVERALERAFRCRRASAVILRISSPGGTASESALLYSKLSALKEKRRNRPIWRRLPGPLEFLGLAVSLPSRLAARVSRRSRPTLRPSPPSVVAFVDDICTSGAFYAACAADEIVAAPSALIGSIGVISKSFGYSKQLRKLGIERRVLTSGDAKAGLDPFMPVRRDALARERKVLDDIHQDFVSTVVKNRKGKLDRYCAADLAARASAHSWTLKGWLSTWPFYFFGRSRRVLRGDGLFDGSVHAARQALRLGLVDDISEETFSEAVRQRYGPRVHIKNFKTSRDYPILAQLFRLPPPPRRF